MGDKVSDVSVDSVPLDCPWQSFIDQAPNAQVVISKSNMPILLTRGIWSFVFEDCRTSASADTLEYFVKGGKSSGSERAKKKQRLEFEDKLALFYTEMEKEWYC